MNFKKKTIESQIGVPSQYGSSFLNIEDEQCVRQIRNILLNEIAQEESNLNFLFPLDASKEEEQHKALDIITDHVLEENAENTSSRKLVEIRNKLIDSIQSYRDYSKELEKSYKVLDESELYTLALLLRQLNSNIANYFLELSYKRFTLSRERQEYVKVVIEDIEESIDNLMAEKEEIETQKKKPVVKFGESSRLNVKQEVNAKQLEEEFKELDKYKKILEEMSRKEEYRKPSEARETTTTIPKPPKTTKASAIIFKSPVGSVESEQIETPEAYEIQSKAKEGSPGPISRKYQLYYK